MYVYKYVHIYGHTHVGVRGEHGHPGEDDGGVAHRVLLQPPVVCICTINHDRAGVRYLSTNKPESGRWYHPNLTQSSKPRCSPARLARELLRPDVQHPDHEELADDGEGQGLDEEDPGGPKEELDGAAGPIFLIDWLVWSLIDGWINGLVWWVGCGMEWLTVYVWGRVSME